MEIEEGFYIDLDIFLSKESRKVENCISIQNTNNIHKYFET